MVFLMVFVVFAIVVFFVVSLLVFFVVFSVDLLLDFLVVFLGVPPAINGDQMCRLLLAPVERGLLFFAQHKYYLGPIPGHRIQASAGAETQVIDPCPKLKPLAQALINPRPRPRVA